MCYRNRLHVRLKEASFAIEAYFIWSRRNLPQQQGLFLSILITKFCILVNLESSNKIGSFEHLEFSIFCF